MATGTKIARNFWSNSISQKFKNHELFLGKISICLGGGGMGGVHSVWVNQPTVYSGGVSRGRVWLWLLELVTSDR